MRTHKRSAALLSILSLITSLLWVLAPVSAHAAESIPPLQWPAVDIGRREGEPVTAPSGSVTMPCGYLGAGSDLVTYNAAGQVIRNLDRSNTIDGVSNCIPVPVIDKNDVLYGLPFGPDTGGTYRFGPNLLAYSGSTLKWKYPLSCGSGPDYKVGADGNIYATALLDDGVHLIGIAPELQAGETQPRKVLDVKLPFDCHVMLQPYKNGIMLHSQQRTYASYYSYGGKFLGDATIGHIWAERINGDGQLFVGQLVGSSPQTVKVSMFDPRLGRVAWSVQASTLNADAQDMYLHPLSTGGVLVVIREQRVDGGAPSPDEYAWKLVRLDALGQKSEPTQLLNTDSNGNTFGGPVVTAQTNGKIAVRREVSIASSSGPLRAIAIGIYDPISRTWDYQELMRGNTEAPDPLTGYSARSFTPTNGTVYLTGLKCNPYGCADSSQTKLYALDVSDASMDYPRGVVLNANTGVQPAPRSYVALGDSFSSGEGVFPFSNDGTVCHRSLDAYSRLLGRDPTKSLRLDQFVACSGAETKHVLNGWYDNDHYEYPQVNALSSGSPKIATITIGGNDIGFPNFGVTCVVGNCNFSSGAYTGAVNAINTTLGSNLEATYKALLEASKSAGTKIYVLGYPQVVANKSASAPYDARCWFMYNSGSTDPWQEVRAARDIMNKLNAKISAKVAAVRALNADYNQRLRFVSLTASTSPFIGHEMCSTGESYFQNLDQYPQNNRAPLHPNEAGQAAYAQRVREAIGE